MFLCTATNCDQAKGRPRRDLPGNQSVPTDGGRVEDMVPPGLRLCNSVESRAAFASGSIEFRRLHNIV